MVARLDEFKGLVAAKGGLARPNMFRVQLPTLPGATREELNLLCRDVQLPSRQIMTRERTIGIDMKKMAYGYAVTDISMTFQLLNDYGVKQYFETWQNLCVNQNTKEIGYKSDYAFPVKIQQLQKNVAVPVYNKSLGVFQLENPITSKDVVYECELIDAFPTSMNAVSLNNDLDGVMELNIQLSYTNWRSNLQPKESSGSSPTVLGVLLGTLLSRFFV